MPDPSPYFHSRSHIDVDVDLCSFLAFEAIGEDSAVASKRSVWGDGVTGWLVEDMVMLSGIIGGDVPCSPYCSALDGTESACLPPKIGGVLSDEESIVSGVFDIDGPVVPTAQT